MVTRSVFRWIDGQTGKPGRAAEIRVRVAQGQAVGLAGTQFGKGKVFGIIQGGQFVRGKMPAQDIGQGLAGPDRSGAGLAGRGGVKAFKEVAGRFGLLRGKLRGGGQGMGRADRISP